MRGGPAAFFCPGRFGPPPGLILRWSFRCSPVTPSTRPGPCQVCMAAEIFSFTSLGQVRGGAAVRGEDGLDHRAGLVGLHAPCWRIGQLNAIRHRVDDIMRPHSQVLDLLRVERTLAKEQREEELRASPGRIRRLADRQKRVARRRLGLLGLRGRTCRGRSVRLAHVYVGAQGIPGRER